MQTKTFTTKECISKPLNVIQHFLVENNNQELQKYFENKFTSKEDFKQIPSLNDIPLDKIPECSLVRFRAMVQNNNFDYEIYMSKFEIIDQNGNKKTKFCKYSDEFEQDIGGEFHNPDTIDTSSSSSSNSFDERQLYYCVSVPGESSWNLHEEHIDTSLEESTANLNLNNSDDQKTSRDNRMSDDEMKKVSAKFPFPNENHVGAIVKIYESENMLKVTDVVEFIGVFNHPRNIPEDNSLGVDVDDPTKLIRVPSIHAIFYRNLHPSGNPNLSSNIITHLTPELKVNILSIRKFLIQYISSVFNGDALVAEFVLLQLLSRTFSRHNGISLVGKLVLNISNLPKCKVTSTEQQQHPNIKLKHDNDFAKNIATMLSSLLPKYHDLPLTLSSLNTNYYYPRSDHVLDSGVFQVNDDTANLNLFEGEEKDEEVLLKFRNFISIQRYSDYTIPENVSEYIQKDFLSQRQRQSQRSSNNDNKLFLSSEDFMLRMTLAR
ncbi:16389_t:CDS:10 [Entrophospora sp. SA101]|nr:16389_t:CDS:10 [Entrophospora sp. SA101]CAJ0858402.1 6845_t:CDS:10 [Entrophospora sp. SA101]CAJ0927579.1 8622_t:CDS:10 [Entrophospora sp. SA101]